MNTSALICGGCDAIVSSSDLLTFSCPHLGQGDVDHVLGLQLGQAALRAGWPESPLYPRENPYLRYRKLSHIWHGAMSAGMLDREYVAIVVDLSEKLAQIDGRPLGITPLFYSDKLGATVKNETVNCSGSHKARHLIATAIALLVSDRLSDRQSQSRAPRPLAIASCGNAALAAAVVAKAAGRALRVFIPPGQAASIVDQLEALGASLHLCERREQDPPGDPCYLRFVEAVRDGALPFSCQGGDNAIALIGGHTLGWEIIEQTPANPASDIFVQVGGGALASSLMQAFAMAHHAGVIASLPRFRAIQTENAHPLVRAWKLFVNAGCDIDKARSHRSAFMWPWESEPASAAGGILDDETYDWLSIVAGLAACGGDAFAVSETRLIKAQQEAQKATSIAVDTTGTAGFAGLSQMQSSRKTLGTNAHPLVLFTGAAR